MFERSLTHPALLTFLLTAALVWGTRIFAAYGRNSRSVGSLDCCFVLFSVLLDADASDIRFLFIM